VGVSRQGVCFEQCCIEKLCYTYYAYAATRVEQNSAKNYTLFAYFGKFFYDFVVLHEEAPTLEEVIYELGL